MLSVFKGIVAESGVKTPKSNKSINRIKIY
jgi:hypothetical protein